MSGHSMIKNIQSETAFDMIKSANKPEPSSTEAARKGATFQSYYSAPDKPPGSEREVISPDHAGAADELQSTLPVDAVDQAESKEPGRDQERLVVEDEDVTSPSVAASDELPAQNIRLGDGSFSLGMAANTNIENSDPTGVNIAALQPRSGGSSAVTQSAQSGMKDVIGQSTHRSIAELRVMGTLPGMTAERQLPQVNTTGQSEQLSGQIANSPSMAATLVSGDEIDAGQVAESVTTARNAAVQPSDKFVAARGAEGVQTTIKANARGTGADLARTQGLSETLQSMMATPQEEQAAPPAAETSEEIPVSTNTVPSRQGTTSAFNTTVQAVSASQNAVAGQVSVSAAEALLDPFSASLTMDPMSAEPAGLSQLLAEAVMSPGTTHRPETPRLVAVQLAEALATKGERNIDVALSPEELGRVKMRVSTTDTSVVVAITTERPETGELMRRHINELTEEFRRMGFEDISFEFSGEGMSGEMADGGEAENSSNNGSSGTADSGNGAENIQVSEQQNLRLGETGLDMRI